MKLIPLVLMCSLFSLVTGCATRFPQPNIEKVSEVGRLDAMRILEDCVAAHGGDLREKEVEKINFSVTGKWGSLIKKIQPLVTDHRYRIDSDEAFFPQDLVYQVKWRGPAGEKTINRSTNQTTVFYDGEESKDPDVLSSSAMTSDAFQLFHFGPSLLRWRGVEPVRLQDVLEKGRRFYQLYFEWEPGFGDSERDEIVVIIDKETNLLYRVWITLEGYRTTKGASVDVTFLEYDSKHGITLPVKFVERVRAPIAIKAHRWTTTDWSVVFEQ